MKRIALAAAVLALLLTSACGGAPAAPTKAPAAPTTAPAAPSPAAATATPAPAQPTKPAIQPTAASLAGTPVANGPLHGDITGNVVWTKSGSPYVVDGTVNVSVLANLIIEPGVELRFGQNTALNIKGKLTALGTVTQPITLTAEGGNPYKGWWSGVTLDGSGAKADLDYVTVRWAGYSRDGSIAGSGGAVINLNHGLIADGRGSGVFTTDKAVANVSNSRFTGNEEFGVEIDDGSVTSNLSALTVKGNGNDAIAYGPGVLAGTRTWKSLGIPYVMKATQQVPVGATLTIEPGVEVRFAQNADLNVVGALKALGTASQPITLTAESDSPYKGWWSGLTLGGNGAKADLDYISVRWAGYSRNGSIEGLSGAVINLNHGVIGDGRGSGVYTSDKAVANVANTQLLNNEEFAIEVEDASVNPTFDALTAKGNGSNAIAYGPGVLAGTRTWKNLGVPYAMKATQQVPAGATLTVEPGVEMRFAQNADLNVAGTLKAVGTAAKPIIFTALSDSPYKGWWSGLTIANNGNLTLDYVTVRWGGYSRSGSLDLSDGAKATIAHSIIRDSRASGVYVASKGSNVTIANSQILDNDDLGVENGDPSSPVVATNNWWGDPSGPTADDNPGGTGSGVSAGVTYKPFLTAAP